MRYPNLLLVSIDSLRADCVSALGDYDGTTPQFDSLAREGRLFENAIAPAVWTLPSHTSLFTGLYPSEHRILSGDTRLGDHPTLAELLSQAGYDTRAFYRLDWLGAGDVLRGFESTDASVDSGGGEGQGFKERVDDVLGHLSPDLKQLARGIYRGTFRGDMPDTRTVEYALDEISGCADPFCFFVHLNDAHWPYSPTAPYHKRFTARSWPHLFWNRVHTQRKLYPGGATERQYQPSAAAIEATKELYLGCVRQTDSHLERLIRGLEELDLLGETIVVVFGDHGEAFGESGLFGHSGCPIPEVAHVPLVISDPTGRIPRGRVDDPVQLNDLYPTLAEIARVDVPTTRSVSLLSESRDFAFTHVFDSDVDVADAAKFYGVWRTAEDYYIWDESSGTIDRTAGSPPDRSVLEHHKSQLRSVEPFTDGSLSETAEENLRQLGYLS